MTGTGSSPAAPHLGQASDRPDTPVDEPDLATWAWHRATSAAFAVLVAGSVGLLLGPFGAFVAAGVAGVAVYLVGPFVALLERRHWRGGAPTPRDLRRHWGMLAALGVVALAVAVARPTLGFGSIVAVVAGGPIALAATLTAVDVGLRLPARFGRPVAVLVPAALLGALANEAGLPLVDGVLVLALVVIVPLAAPTLAVDGPLAADRRTATGLGWLAVGVLAVGGVLVGRGATAAALTAPFVLTCLGVAATRTVATLASWSSRTGKVPMAARLRTVAIPLAHGYLAFGSLWLFADRSGFEPAGFGPPFVQLTAIHFTYAGFVATLLARLVWIRHPRHVVAGLGLLATAAGPPVVAIGFAAAGVLQIVGAVVLTVGTYAVAWVTLRHVAADGAAPRGVAARPVVGERDRPDAPRGAVGGRRQPRHTGAVDPADGGDARGRQRGRLRAARRARLAPRAAGPSRVTGRGDHVSEGPERHEAAAARRGHRHRARPRHRRRVGTDHRVRGRARPGRHLLPLRLARRAPERRCPERHLEPGRRPPGPVRGGHEHRGAGHRRTRAARRGTRARQRRGPRADAGRGADTTGCWPRERTPRSSCGSTRWRRPCAAAAGTCWRSWSTSPPSPAGCRRRSSESSCSTAPGTPVTCRRWRPWRSWRASCRSCSTSVRSPARAVRHRLQRRDRRG